MREVFNDINENLKYSTRRRVVIDSYILGIWYRVVQLLLLILFVAYVFIDQEKYRYTDVYPIHLSTNIVGSEVILDN